MTYQETLNYLFNALPMYQNIGKAAYKADLKNTVDLLAALDHPQNNFKSIHVAGTNGKGSTSHALASVLQEAGYKTGLYTSPHLKSFTERIKINGVEIDEANVVTFVKENKQLLERVEPSFFEMTVAMAFDYFSRQQVDYAVIEVGLGGRLDSTNIIHPLLSVITNIGLDHVQFLGNTHAAIAREKAGIIKKGVPIVISESHPDTEPVFREVALEQHAPIYFADQVLQVETGVFDPLRSLREYQVRCKEEAFFFEMDLAGNYQIRNLGGILQALALLEEKIPGIDYETVQRGLKRIIANTGLKGRWQQLGVEPLIYCDTGHNSEGIKLIIEQIQAIPHRHLYMIVGMSNDKDISPVLSLLPKEAFFIFCEAKVPRAMSAERLCSKAEEAGINGKVVPDVNEALAQVLAKAGKQDLIFIGGSTFVVAELERL